ncbi:Acyl-coenzyme A thioesterase THEM4-like protein 1 [Colletotrichum musicola]|uniref:Acyl-coenzyme A thioesterase THEM4-like protein 1 n=1 Tax=Colletotrichum musicola TaxID=2175873 RepID=A0A8H6K659_9PEZI|nr:Acyl-coenzyme A thioesterase THEM4-like protein 1 [Colletotrichum musicola]
MEPVTPDAKHFLAIPWCAAHLNTAGVVHETATSRFAKPSTEDELFAKTLNTENTIAAFLTFYKRPEPASTTAAVPAADDGVAGNIIREIKCLLTLRSGVNGYPGVCHGGIVAAILDETLGFLFSVNRDNGLADRDSAYMTAYLNTQYVLPVQTPQTVLVVVTAKRAEGRKFWIDGRMEDEDGRVLAKAESLFVRLKEKL